MIIERIVYCLVCLILFGYITNKFLKSRSSVYLSLLSIQLVCMITQLIAFFTNIYVDAFMQIYVFTFNILLPSVVFAAEYLNINLEEFIEIKLGDFYARRSDYDKAIAKYKKAVSKNNSNAQTFAKLGRLYNAKGDRRTAFDRFARAIELDRNDYRSYYEIGVIFNDLGKQADAQIVLDNALRIKPDFTPASELLAVVLCAQNKYDEAINVYKNATRYDSDNYELYYRMGVVRTELRDFKEAKECYEKAIELNPTLYQAYFSLGQINLLKGELEHAEAMFKKSLNSKDLTAKSYYQLAKVYILNDEEIKAVTYLGYAINIDSSYKYKAESEPLFSKIRDYITGLSMANKVMQQAENVENLKRIEKNIEQNDEREVAKIRYENLTEELEEQENSEIPEEIDKTENGEDEVQSKQGPFFKMMKNILGVEEETEGNIEEQELEDDEANRYMENSEELEETSDETEKIYEFYKENFSKENVLENGEEQSEEEKLDIFEKFKRLKKAEDEKAERFRRMQKIKELEELRKQNDLSNKEESDDPIIVRVVEDSIPEESSHSNASELENVVNSAPEVSGENETFEDEDTMDGPHFDFMDRFKR